MTAANNIESNIIELKFQGNNIRPDLISNKEIAAMLLAFDNAIMPIFKEQNPEISSIISPITFKDIGYKSISFRNTIREHSPKVKAAFTTLVLSISTQTSEGIPSQSQSAIKKIISFSDRHSCDAAFGYSQDGVFFPLTDIEPFQKHSFQKFKEVKEYYGRLVKLDVELLQSFFRLVNGQVLKCKINQENIESYRLLIGEEVKINGIATISGRTLKRTSFELTQITKHSLMNIDETLSSIRGILN